jgi:DNA-binding CsgD family transcriptional regulator
MSKRGKRVLTPRERELARRVAAAKKARRRYAKRLAAIGLRSQDRFA